MNLLDLFVKVGLKDEATAGLSKITSAVGTGIKSAAAVGSAAVGAAGAAVLSLTKEATNAFADYEQLVGGVDTLFGKSANDVLGYAKNAYKTAGLSANEYMETVTSFSASLLQGLGGDTAEAARIANLAVTDMADNANKMGTDMASIQNAYQGFAKQNYTMLDNLKLGYGGTKEEMLRLVNAAAQIDQSIFGTKKEIESLDDVSFDQIIKSIHAVQNNLDITGTTAKEASTTITGSLASMKSAWQNVLTALSGGTDEFGYNLKDAMDGLIGTIVGEGGKGGVINNIKNAVEPILESIPALISGLSQPIAEIIPEIVNNVMPSIVTSITEIVKGASGIIPSLISLITENAPMVMDAGISILEALGSGILENIDSIVDSAINLVDSFTQKISDNSQSVTEGAIDIIAALAEGLAVAIPKIWEATPKIMSGIVAGFQEKLPMMKETGARVLQYISEGLTENIPAVMEQIASIIPSVIEGITEAVPVIIETIANVLTSLSETLAEKIPEFLENVLPMIMQLTEKLHESAPQLIEAGLNMILQIAQGLINGIPQFVTYVPTIVSNLANIINDNAPKVIEAGIQLIIALVKGLIDAIPTIVANIPQIITAIVDVIMAFDWLNLGGKIITGIGNGVAKMGGALKNFFTNGFSGALQYIKGLPKQALTWGKDLIQSFINGITQKWHDLIGTLSNAAATVKDFLGFSEPKKGPLSNFHTYAPDMMKLFAEGIRENEDVVTSQISKSFDFGNITVPMQTSETNRVGNAVQEIVINITEQIDGAVLARNQYRYNVAEQKRHGISFVRA